MHVRVGAVGFGVLETILTPGNRLVDGILVGLLVVACGLVVLALRAEISAARLSVVGWAAMSVDATVAAGLMFANASYWESSIFLLAVLIALEAAVRWGWRGGFTGGVLAGLLTAAWSVFRHVRFGYPDDVSAVTFQFGMMVLLGALAGAAMNRLALRGRTLRRTLEVSRDLIAVLTPDGVIRGINPASVPILGFRPEELVGHSYSELLPPGAERGPGLAGLLELGLQHRSEQQVLRRDGKVVWLEIDVTLVPEEGVGYCVARDITERRRMEDALRESEARYRLAAERYRSLFDRNPDAVFSQDAEGRFVSLNQAFAELCGYSPHELRASSFDILGLSADPGRTVAHFQRALAGEAQDFETTIRHRQGHVLDVHVTYIPIVVDGEQVGVYGVANDVTERRRLERQLSHQAFHDTLTGLPNRALFLDRLGHALSRHGAVPGRCAVLFLDLDHFKLVNDGLGHHVGDRLLQQVAERLTGALEAGHTISRFGGDEFTVLVEDLASPTEATRYAEALLAALAPPFTLDGQEVFCSASVGIAVATSLRDGPEELLRRADSAMYRAKERGRGRHVTFDSGMHERAVARLALETQLRRAVERGEFVLEYQPEVSLSSGRIVGVEGLLRWDHPERGLLPPAQFLGEAAEAHLLEPIGKWVIDEACRQLRRWRDLPSTAGITVSVNLSAPELVRPELVEHVATALGRHRVASDSLVLEITEGALMDDPAAVLNILARLKGLGVGLAIDDFGTGYSSLAYLQRFPVDVIKIDRTFVDGLGLDAGDEAIVEAVLGLSHALDLVTVAEGVEHPDQLARLMALGCDLGQGYLFAMPTTPDGIAALAAAGPWSLSGLTRAARGEATAAGPGAGLGAVPSQRSGAAGGVAGAGRLTRAATDGGLAGAALGPVNEA